MNLKTLGLNALTLAVLTGCQLAPEQQEIALPVPDAYASGAEQAQAHAAKLAAVF